MRLNPRYSRAKTILDTAGLNQGPLFRRAFVQMYTNPCTLTVSVSIGGRLSQLPSMLRALPDSATEQALNPHTLNPHTFNPHTLNRRWTT